MPMAGRAATGSLVMSSRGVIGPNWWKILRVVEIVCAYYEIERTELSRRGSRHPARATLAYLARSRTMSTNADLAVTLGLSRAECVPNLTRRFTASLAADAKVRRQLKCLEEKLDEYGPSELT
jgi:hypothetical protein